MTQENISISILPIHAPCTTQRHWESRYTFPVFTDINHQLTTRARAIVCAGLRTARISWLQASSGSGKNLWICFYNSNSASIQMGLDENVSLGQICLKHALCCNVAFCSNRCFCGNDCIFDPQDNRMNCMKGLIVLEVALRTMKESLWIVVTPYLGWKLPTVTKLFTKLNLESKQSVFEESKRATLVLEQQAPMKKQLSSSPPWATQW